MAMKGYSAFPKEGTWPSDCFVSYPGLILRLECIKRRVKKWWKEQNVVYYIKISITTVIQVHIQIHRWTLSFQIRTGLLISGLRCMVTRRERHNSLKPMLTILHWPYPNARRILWCLRSQFISAGRDPKNSTTCLNDRKPNYIFQRSNTQLPSQRSTDVFSKSSNSLDHLFWAWRHQQASPFPVRGWVVIRTNGDCHILCVWA